MARKQGKRDSLAAWLAQEQPREIGPSEWEALLLLLAPVSESYLRRLLRASGAPLAPLVEGIRQESFEALEKSLSTFAGLYEQAGAAQRAGLRRLVIAAREHARWASRRSDKQSEKEEMMSWMLTWLENPSLFPQWVRLRRAAMGWTTFGHEET